MTTWLDRIKLGITAFREAYLTSPVIDAEDWSDQSARYLRYSILWAQYEQTSYRDVHTWAKSYRQKYGLYKYTRPIYNPAYRLGEFWKAHLFGGPLCPVASNSGAIPIAADNDSLRTAIAELWKWSRWGTVKDILAIRGTILGDSIIRVVDDVARGKVYLSLLHPGLLASVDKDPFGNVKGYTLQETRANPEGAGTAQYREMVGRDGEDVVYQTYRNGELYAWPGNVNRDGEAVATWSEPYGFIPLVAIQHNDVGLEWGWSELHPIRSKVQEADDLASLIGDQMRKTIDPVWLMKGIKKINLAVGADADSEWASPGREEIQALWGLPTDASAEAMVAELDFSTALTHIDSILEEIERDVIELGADIHTASGDASGRALRVARQPVETKVLQRRGNYDAGLVAAQQMAIAIGGWRGYSGYEGFDLDSYQRGDLVHSIDSRPVFSVDPLDKWEITSAAWVAALKATTAGVNLSAFLRDEGWSDERIADLTKPDKA